MSSIRSAATRDRLTWGAMLWWTEVCAVSSSSCPRFARRLMSFFPDTVDGCEILHQLKTVVSPTIYGVSTIQDGAGFLPSTVGTQSCCFFFPWILLKESECEAASIHWNKMWYGSLGKMIGYGPVARRTYNASSFWFVSKWGSPSPMVYQGLSSFSPWRDPEIALTLQLFGKFNIIWKVESPIFSCFFFRSHEFSLWFDWHLSI